MTILIVPKPNSAAVTETQLEATTLESRILKTVQGSVEFTPWPRRVPKPTTPEIFGLSTTSICVSESFLIINLVETQLRIDYPSIVIYAISRGGTTPEDRPCIYCQHDTGTVESNNNDNNTSSTQENEDSDDEGEDADGVFEIRLIPDDPSTLEDLYEAMATCAALHPDKNLDEMDDSDDAGDWIMTADDYQDDLAGARQAALDHLENVFVGGVRKEPDDRFEDADEGENENGGGACEESVAKRFKDEQEER
ncbi:hypothetical protein HK100_000976 [Physocladia obscura]|uniref:Uncharacterized protein n=1 Tax=Physocladia obscura TaxID=109957 RepID=A0AAD5XBE4_9FUNG|nr:hypothetical protein HK100_000976 [Physocladia obscura]